MEAYRAAPHGGAIERASGTRLEKWMADKPGLPPAEVRFVQQNMTKLDPEDMAAADWEVAQ